MTLLSPDLAQKVQKALAAWTKIMGGKLSTFGDQLSLNRVNKEDSTGVLIALELSRLAETAKQSIQFTAAEVMKPSKAVKEKLTFLQLLEEISDNPEIQNILRETREMITSTAEKLGVAKKVQKTLKTDVIGELIRSAESGFNRLCVHQFSQGEERRPKFHLNEWIYAFGSMHELVCALARQPVDGLTLCLVLDKDIAEYSVFAWALKTGSTLTVLCEDNGLSHQNQKFMRRNPGRNFERRAEGLHYPYSIFKLEETSTASGSGTQFRIKGIAKEGKNKGALSLHNVEAHRVKRIEQLAAEEITWLILLANLIYKDYWLEGKKTKQLSYTGEMIDAPETVPQLLQAPNEGPALLMAASEPATPLAPIAYQPLVLTELTAEKIKETGENPKNWEGPTGGRSGLKDWMVHRYEDQVNTDALAKTAPALLALPAARKQKDPFDDDKKKSPIVPLNKSGTLTTHSGPLKNDNAWLNGPKTYEIDPFEPKSLFGTPQEIEKERFYIARSNQAEAIQALADQEFAERCEEVLLWFKEAVRKNLPALKKAIVAGSFQVPTLMDSGETFTNTFKEKNWEMLRLWMDGKDAKGEEPYTGYGLQQRLASVHQGVKKDYSWKYKCCEDGTFTKNYAVFEPFDGKCLAALVGLPMSELPPPLEHWRDANRSFGYIGNSILNLIDPVERLKNPWGRMDFAVDIHFSKRAYARWQKGEFRDADVQITHYPEYEPKRLFRIA